MWTMMMIQSLMFAESWVKSQDWDQKLLLDLTSTRETRTIWMNICRWKDKRISFLSDNIVWRQQSSMGTVNVNWSWSGFQVFFSYPYILCLVISSCTTKLIFMTSFLYIFIYFYISLSIFIYLYIFVYIFYAGDVGRCVWRAWRSEIQWVRLEDKLQMFPRNKILLLSLPHRSLCSLHGILCCSQLCLPRIQCKFYYRLIFWSWLQFCNWLELDSTLSQSWIECLKIISCNFKWSVCYYVKE